MNHEQRRKVALFRYAVLGPLVSARLCHGDRQALFRLAASRIHEHPNGRKMKLSARTVEDWYYAYLARGLKGLYPKVRKDAARNKAVADDIAALLVFAKTQRPGRTIRQLIRILERAKKVEPDTLSPATVHRLLRRAGVPTHRPKEHGDKQRRAFLPEHASDLWMGDVMHGPYVRHGDKRKKAYLISIIDAATRFLVGSRFMLSESAVDHEAVLKQAIRVHGRPRVYYVDRGAAYKSDSLKAICAELGIEFLHTQARDAEAKGAIERWHRTWRTELGVELQGKRFDLDFLQAAHRAWLAREYHARVHSTTEKRPQAHFLAEVAAGHCRPLPKHIDIEAVFLHRKRRRVRKDNTVNLHGKRFELTRFHLATTWVELRFDPRDHDAPPKVFKDGDFVCDTRALDLHQNARRRRKRLPVHPESKIQAPEHHDLDPVADLIEEHYGSDFKASFSSDDESDDDQ
jgi:transposase InsO family protein